MVKQILVVLATLALVCAACDGNDVTMRSTTTTTTTIGPAPTVSSIIPTSGKTVGGTAVTVTGSNFNSAASLTLGAVAATNVSVAAGGTSLTATTGARGAGNVEVVVRNPDGQSSTLGNGFAYVLVRANPGGPYSIQANRNITMSGLTSTSTLPIAHYFWDCGQMPHGKPCAPDTPTPTFEYLKTAKLGTEVTYTVTLTIEDTLGNRDTATTTVKVTQAYE